ncbi:MAG: succinate dehydrogenase, cytochrome b556 subunit [Caulobacteraceae bacterium]|nr:succinate dehydrogenase, cytochrome b556 subunit [Caulobacteraceae bacterium]
MADSARGARPRPLSPHLQIWRWHVTMAGSILHRVSGVALYLGALILMGWALCLASGPESYQTFKELVGSRLGRFVLFIITLSVFYHLANGIRHLAWDAGYGFNIKTADLTGVAAITFAIVAAAAIWFLASMTGAL